MNDPYTILRARCRNRTLDCTENRTPILFITVVWSETNLNFLMSRSRITFAFNLKWFLLFSPQFKMPDTWKVSEKDVLK